MRGTYVGNDTGGCDLQSVASQATKHACFYAKSRKLCESVMQYDRAAAISAVCNFLYNVRARASITVVLTYSENSASFQCIILFLY